MRGKTCRFSLFLILAFFTPIISPIISACGGEKKQPTQPSQVATLEEEPIEEDIDLSKVKLSPEEEKEFNEGTVTQVEKEEPTTVGEKSTSTEKSAPPVPTGSGPGTLKLTLKVLGEEIKGEVRVISEASNSVIAKGKDKSTFVFSVPAGAYQIDAIFPDAVNEPKLTLNHVQVPPGGKVERVFNFPMARVKFIPMKAGTNKIVRGFKLRLKAKGGEQWYPKVVKPMDFIYISPGNYEGQLFRGKGKRVKTIDIPSIQVNEGAKAQKRIDVNI